jgi:NADH-quinone oxidoreductase subunit L
VLGAVHDKAHELAHHEASPHDGAQHGVLPQGANASAAAITPAPLTLIAPETAAFVYQALYYSALVTALLTAFYTFRAYFMTFHGEERIPAEAGHHAHESPLPMLAPLAILAACAIGVGIVFNSSFAAFLIDAPSLAAGAVATTTAPGKFHYDVAVISSMVALAGIALAGYFYLGESRQIDRITSLMNLQWLIRLTDPQTVSNLQRVRWIAFVQRSARSIGLGWLVSLLGYALLVVLLILATPLLVGYFISPFRLSRDKFYLDEIYNWLVVGPLRFAAAVSYWIDRFVVDGLVNLFGRLPPWIGSLMRSLQMGLVQFYALAMVLGVLILVTARMLFAS